MKYRLIALLCVFASTAAAQLDSYLGPGILTRGAGDIGSRAGQEVNLRFYAGVSGVYDNGIEPLALDSKGNLAQVNGLYGVEADLGAYGTHQWRTALLGLDYRGSFTHYSQQSYYDGTDHRLLLGYTYQKSRRLIFDLQETAGTYSSAIGSVPGAYVPISSVVGQPTSLLFDNRNYFGESAASATYLLSARTSVTAGGQGFLVRYRADGLVGVNGYGLRGSIQHRLSRATTIGAAYEHEHFDFPRAYGQSDIDTVMAVYGTQFGRHWTFSLDGGVFQAEVQGIESVALDPSIAALLGVGTSTQRFYQKRIFPAGDVRLTRQFKNASFSIFYNRSVTPGNGVYLTSRSELSGASLDYTGIRKFSFSISGGEASLASVGQSIQGYRQFTGGAGMTYAITRALHFTARYDARHQDITYAGFRRTSDRAMIGLIFSPGDVPLSLW
ncbi:MAG TPA: hypothetical protein VFW83_08405 [Bryobacteraceae bacterium]|nr:hypothetical protein [Bryobacteraceae bacterium]